MDFSRLEKNITDVIKEEQIKLGYRKEVIRFFYPVQSLNRHLRTDLNSEEMQKILEEYFLCTESPLNGTKVSNQNDRFCFLVPEEAVEYVHVHTKEHEFIRDFIETVRVHGCTMEQILDIFRHYSDHVHFEKVDHGEFDYLIYFEDGVPDEFRYCITEEGTHMIYHRFMPGDYEDFGF